MKFFAELRRRNVFRVAAAYAVIAWLLIEVSDTILPRLGLPEWTVTLVIALLLLGFPVALVLAWAFELTPDGVKRASEIDAADQAGPAAIRAIDYAILGGLALVGAMVLWQQLGTPEAPASGGKLADENITEIEAPAPASIAVLPFADLSPEGDQEYFSDGITEEILNVLARVDGLQVASRTSAFQFKTRPAAGIPEIARELNVRHVLEGSVRKAGQAIRVTAQLIDTSTDRHLWSENYDRPLSAENVFMIQEDIATAIVGALRENMGLAAAPPVRVAVSTRNLEAYELLLRARSLFIERGIENMRQSIQLLEEAVKQDPAFAEAWGLLASVNTALASWVISDEEDFGTPAREAAARAIELNPELAMPYAAQGFVLQKAFEWSEAIARLEEAVARAPDNATAIFWRGLAMLRLGYFDAAEDDLKECLRLEPLYANCHIHLSYLEMFRGNPDAANEYFLEGIAQGFEGYKPKLSYMLYQMGEKGAALQLVRYMYHWSPAFVDAWQLAVEGDAAQRERAIAEWNQAATEFMPALVDAPDILFEAQAYDRISVTDRVYPDTLIQYAIWNPFYPGLRNSADFKRLLRELRIDEYWREHGFPPKCRPVGENDFDCD